MKQDRFDDFDDEVRELVLNFEKTVLKGESQFFDIDELEMIMDYYITVNDQKPLERAVQYAEQLYPNSSEVLRYRAQMMIIHGQYKQALKQLGKLREAEPDDVDLAYVMGTAYSAMGDHEKAIECYKEATSDDWMLDRVYASIGEEYYKLRKFDMAAEYYKQAVELNPQEDVTIYNYYDSCYEAGKVEEAVDYLKDFVKKEPYSYEGWYSLGCAYRDMSLYEQAVDAFEFAIAINKSFFDSYLSLSLVQDLMGRSTDAVTTLLRSLDCADDRAMVYRCVGSIYDREGNSETALAYFKKALEENPSDAETYAALAECTLHNGEAAAAVSLVNKALDLDEMAPRPDMPQGNPAVFFAAGIIYDAIGEYLKASDYFDQMFTTDLYNESQCQTYVRFLFKHKNYDILIQFSEESLEVYPHSPFYSSYLAAAYFYTNRYNRARRMLPDVDPVFLAELCPEIMTHPLLGLLVPTVPNVNQVQK